MVNHYYILLGEILIGGMIGMALGLFAFVGVAVFGSVAMGLGVGLSLFAAGTVASGLGRTKRNLPLRSWWSKGRAGARTLTVAVGTWVTPGSPRGSVRAAFPHTAPTSGA